MTSITSSPQAAPASLPSTTDANRPQSPWSGLLAALPTLLIGLLLFLPEGLHAWGVPGIPGQSTGPASLPYILFLTIILVGIFVAWRRSWPAWGGAYYFIAWLVPLLYLTYRSGSQAALLLCPPLLAVLCYRLAVVDRLKFLLAILPVLVIAWPTWMEFVPVKVENLEFTLVFCLAALVAYWILRRGDWRQGIWLVLGLNTLAGVTATIVYSFSAEYPGHIPQITSSNFLENLAPVWLAGAAILLCPLMLASLRELARRSGRAGRLGFWLIFAALLAWMTASFSVFFQGSGNDIPFNEPAFRNIYQIVVLVCGLLFLTGAVLLIYSAMKLQALPEAWAVVLLTLLPAGMPWLFNFILSGGISGPILAQSALILPLVNSIGMIWALLSAWLVTHIRFPSSESPVHRWGGTSSGDATQEEPAAAAA